MRKIRLVCDGDTYHIEAKTPGIFGEWYVVGEDVVKYHSTYDAAKKAFNEYRECFLKWDQEEEVRKEKKKAIRIKFLYHPLPSDDPNIRGDE